MTKYIDADKLIAEIERELSAHDKVDHLEAHEVGKAWNRGHRKALENILDFITSLQQEQPIRESHKGSWIEETKKELQHEEELLDMRLETLRRIRDKKNQFQQEQPCNIIQWTGNNLKEVIGFTGKSPRFDEWFKSWEEFENYVHTHNDILKLFCEDGSHYEVPVGAWIVKTPDGYNVPSIAKYIQREQPIKVYRVENEKEQKGLWRKFDGTWEPLFDMLTDGQCKDMPMEDNPIYREGGKQWFASAPSKETLQKWFSKRDLEELTAKGFTISEFEVVGHKKINDFEYIFTRDSIISRTYLKVSDIYPQEQPEVDLEKEIDDWYNTMGIPITTNALKETARHFYELGLNARKE